jgi:hypothetical protein
MKHGAAASLLNVHFQISCADGDVLEESISLDLKNLNRVVTPLTRNQ